MSANGIEQAQAFTVPMGELGLPSDEITGQEYLDGIGFGDIGIIDVVGHEGDPMTVARAIDLCPRITGAIDVMIAKGRKFVPAEHFGDYVRESVVEIVAPPPTEEMKARMSNILAAAAMREPKKKLESAAASPEALVSVTAKTAIKTIDLVKPKLVEKAAVGLNQEFKQVQIVEAQEIARLILAKPIQEIEAAQEARKAQSEHVPGNEFVKTIVSVDAKQVQTIVQKPPKSIKQTATEPKVVPELVVKTKQASVRKGVLPKFRQLESTVYESLNLEPQSKRVVVEATVKPSSELPIQDCSTNEIAYDSIHDSSAETTPRTLEIADDLDAENSDYYYFENFFAAAPAHHPETKSPFTLQKRYDAEPVSYRQASELIYFDHEPSSEEIIQLPTLITESPEYPQIQEKMVTLEPEQLRLTTEIIQTIAMAVDRLQVIRDQPESSVEIKQIEELIDGLCFELFESLDIYDRKFVESFIKNMPQTSTEQVKKRDAAAKRIKFLEGIGTHELKLAGIGFYGIQSQMRPTKHWQMPYADHIGKLTLYHSHA